MDLSRLLCDRLYAERGRTSDARPEAEKVLREMAFVLHAVRRVREEMRQDAAGRGRP